MSRDERFDPNQSDDKREIPSSSPRDPIERDPLNPAAPQPNIEPERRERPDLDWTEHED